MSAGAVEVLVHRDEMRSALAAVLVHASKKPDDLTSRVRLTLAPDPMVDELWTLYVSATDTYTGAIARVKVAEEPNLGDERWAKYDAGTLDEEPVQEPIVVDLPLSSVDNVVRVFRPTRNESLDDPLFRLYLGAGDTTWTEDGLLVEGRTLTVPRLAPFAPAGADRYRYPDVPRILYKIRQAGSESHQPVRMNPDLIARFLKSAKALDTKIDLRYVEEPNALVVMAGPRFLGFAGTWKVEPVEAEHRVNWGRLWDDRNIAIRQPEPPKTGKAGVQEDDGASNVVSLRIPPPDVRAVEGDDQHATATISQIMTPALVLAAAEAVIDTQWASARMLERKLNIGPSHALALLEVLEQAGIVSEADSVLARAVLVAPAGKAEALKRLAPEEEGS